MIRKSSYFLPALLAAGLAPVATSAQVPQRDAIAPLLRAQAWLDSAGASLGPAVWPGYRPDTIAVAFLLPRQGVLLVGWRGPLPPGFAPVMEPDSTSGQRRGRPVAWAPVVDPSGASTAAELGGRMVAQVNVGGVAGAPLTGLVAHEAFHVFERATGGAGAAVQENTAVMAEYPIFDADNERDLALEGALLASALRSRAAGRSLAEQFLAVRESRQRRLDADVAAFERGAELNEGRAEYALVRATEAAGGGSAVAAIAARLDSLVQPDRSVRGRFYVTGAAQALLLDRLAGPAWKREFAAWGGTLQDALAHALGYRAREAGLVRTAYAAHDRTALDAAARARVSTLRAHRRSLADSLLARPGLLLVLAGDSVGGIGLCGFDPQNLLPAGDDVFLHTRWLRPCAAGLQGDLNAPTVEDRRKRLLRVVVGAPDSVRVTVAGASTALADGRPLAGTDVRVDAPGAHLTVRRALLERRGRELWLTPLRP